MRSLHVTHPMTGATVVRVLSFLRICNAVCFYVIHVCMASCYSFIHDVFTDVKLLYPPLHTSHRMQCTVCGCKQ